MVWGVYAADVSPAEPEAGQSAWFPRADGDQVGSRDAGAPPKEGPQAVDRADRLEARGPLTPSERLSRRQRLAGASDYRRVLDRGSRHRAVLLDIIWAVNDVGHPRLGLVVPRFQSSAVARNRLRRWLKEIMRRGGLAELGPVDVVIRIRRGAYQARASELRAEVNGWLTTKAPSRG